MSTIKSFGVLKEEQDRLKQFEDSELKGEFKEAFDRYFGERHHAAWRTRSVTRCDIDETDDIPALDDPD